VGNELASKSRCVAKILGALPLKGKGDRRYPPKRAFKRGPDRTGIKQIRAKVEPVVNSGKAKIRFPGHEMVQREVHAVDGGAIDSPHIRGNLLGSEGMVQTDAMGGRAPLPIGRNQYNVANIAQGVRQSLNTRRTDTIVIAN
jgi:hypothetical protein